MGATFSRCNIRPHWWSTRMSRPPEDVYIERPWNRSWSTTTPPEDQQGVPSHRSGAQRPRAPGGGPRPVTLVAVGIVSLAVERIQEAGSAFRFPQRSRRCSRGERRAPCLPGQAVGKPGRGRPPEKPNLNLNPAQRPERLPGPGGGKICLWLAGRFLGRVPPCLGPSLGSRHPAGPRAQQMTPDAMNRAGFPLRRPTTPGAVSWHALA